MSYEVASAFWKSRIDYPAYPNVKERRLIDINFVLSYIDNPKSVLDLGCADGYLLLVLRELSDIELFYGYDISKSLISKLINRWGDTKINLQTYTGSFIDRVFPNTDLTLAMGSFPYIFNDNDLDLIVKRITSKQLIVRVPCTSNNKDEYIDVFSEDLVAQYASIYRTPSNYMKLLQHYYTDVDMYRAYPDELESKYGTKQYFFVCNNRKGE